MALLFHISLKTFQVITKFKLQKIRILFSSACSNVDTTLTANSMGLDKKSSRTVTRILVNLSATLLRAAESSKTTLRKIGWLDISKKETLLTYFSIITKAAKKNTIKSSKLFTKKEATGLTTKSSWSIGFSSTKKFKKSSATLQTLKLKPFNKENSKYSKKYNKILSAKTITCQAQLL